MLRRSKVLIPRLSCLAQWQAVSPLHSTLASSLPTEEPQSSVAGLTLLNETFARGEITMRWRRPSIALPADLSRPPGLSCCRILVTDSNYYIWSAADDTRSKEPQSSNPVSLGTRASLQEIERVCWVTFLPEKLSCRYDEHTHERFVPGDPSKRAFTYFVLTGGRFVYASALRLAILKLILSMTVSFPTSIAKVCSEKTCSCGMV